MKNIYRLKMFSPNLSSLAFFEKKARRFQIGKLIRLPKQKKIFTLQKSPFVQSKAKEHFQLVTYKRLYVFKITFKELKQLLAYIPVDVSVTIERELFFD